MKKRIFIAIELPKEIKQNLLRVQQNFKDLKVERSEIPTAVGTKCVKSEHMHLTMVFLGDIDEARISEIEEICSKVAKNFLPFEMEFIGLGAFPNSRQPHILWVGIKDSEKLISLQKELAVGLKRAGFRIEDRKFVPHLTLARLRKRVNLKAQIEKFNKANFGKMKISEIYIFESELGPDGPKHKIIKTLQLKD